MTQVLLCRAPSCLRSPQSFTLDCHSDGFTATEQQCMPRSLWGQEATLLSLTGLPAMEELLVPPHLHPTLQLDTEMQQGFLQPLGADCLARGSRRRQ